MEWFIIAVFVLGFGWFLWKREQRKREAASTVVAMGLGRFSVIFAKDVASSALPVEIDLCIEAERALVAMGWGDVGQNGIQFWPVRSPGQDVIYRGRRLSWRDVPAVVGIDARGDGYGGMRDGKNIYVAFYHEGRAPDALMAHELTHAVMPTTSHGHPGFLDTERRLLAEMRGTSNV